MLRETVILAEILTSRETRRLALEAVQLVFENVEQAYRDGNNYEARKNMLHAAYKAGIAFSKSYVGYIHAIAHSLGGKYGTAHGFANAVIMPYMLEEYGPCVYKKLHQLGVIVKPSAYSPATSEIIKKSFVSAFHRNMWQLLPEEERKITPCWNRNLILFSLPAVRL